MIIINIGCVTVYVLLFSFTSTLVTATNVTNRLTVSSRTSFVDILRRPVSATRWR